MLDQQIAQLKSELADLNGRFVESKVTLRYQQLKSPVDGVALNKAHLQWLHGPIHSDGDEGGSNSFTRSKSRKASSKIGFVQVLQGCPEDLDVCMNADISIDSFPPVISGF